MKYRKNVNSGVVRIPKELAEVFGKKIIIYPGLCAAGIYGSDEDKKRVIKSLQLVIEELRQEIRLEAGRERDRENTG